MTESHETFTNAPIREAVVSIRLDEGSKYDKDLLEELSSQVPEGYSKPEEAYRTDQGIQFIDGEFQPQPVEIFFCYRSTNESSRFLAQYQIDGFSLSKLNPYQDWHDLKSEARKLWGLYRSLKPALKIDQISLQYNNEIRMPLVDGQVVFDDYLQHCPSMPDGMPDGVNSFVTSIDVPYVDLGVIATITQLFSSHDTDHAKVILDINVLRNKNLELSIDALWSAFDELREIKNTAFFGSITEKAKELFR